MENFDYEKAYKAVLQTATQWIKDGCTDKEKICLESVFPELRESEDERNRKWILEYLYDGLRKADEQFKDHFKSAIDWLEKQKEIQFGVPGLYYYNGEKVYYYGSPATEEKIEKQDVDFSTNDTSKNDARKRRQIIALLSASKGKCMASFAKDIDECVAYLIEKQKEQKPHRVAVDTCEAIDKVREFDEQMEKEQEPVESGITNNESDYDRGYREGHKFGLEQTEWYRLLGGKTFMGLIPCWVNAPSALQPAHKHHGKNLIVMHENNGGFRCCCVDDEKPITFHLPEDTHLVEGWNKKPAEWSEEDEQYLLVCKNALQKYQRTDQWDASNISAWLEERLKSLRPQPHWKPTEEQMKDLMNAENVLRKYKYVAIADKVAELHYCLEQLKQS